MKPTSIIQFQDTSLDVFDHNGQRWVREGQIVPSLGIAREALKKLIKRHRSEFGPDETALIWADTAGGVQKVRVFSPRGLKRIALLTNSPQAAHFRDWALDVLEAGALPALPPAAPAAAVSALEAENALLRDLVLKANPRWERLLRCVQAGLTRAETARVLDVCEEVVSRERRKLEACGLLQPPANLSRLQAAQARAVRARLEAPHAT